jgi:tRNA 2-thiouridine synthesizing protein A
MQAADSTSRIVDARGMPCPQPLVLAKMALRDAAGGAVIEIQATDPLAPLDIEALCARGACHYLGCTIADDEGVLRIWIRAPNNSSVPG